MLVLGTLLHEGNGEELEYKPKVVQHPITVKTDRKNCIASYNSLSRRRELYSII